MGHFTQFPGFSSTFRFISSSFSSKCAGFRTISSEINEKREKRPLFPRGTLLATLALAAAVSLPGCGITGAMVRMKCSHDQMRIKECWVYPKLTRERIDKRV